jgi:hypothetical protein
MGWVKAGMAPGRPAGMVTTAAAGMAVPSWPMPLIDHGAGRVPSAEMLAILWPRALLTLKESDRTSPRSE